MTFTLRGVLTALPTPFTGNNTVDEDALRRVVDHSIHAGVDGVVVGGSTAEVGALSIDERHTIVDVVIQHTAGRVPVVAQTGATSTAQAIELSRAAQQAGADVLMLVTPYYEPLTIEETVAYLRDVAASTDLPVMLYNMPAATGVNLDADTVRRLATEIENVKYIKDSSANWEQALRLIHYHADVIDTFIGWDSYAYSALAEGAAGIVAGTANVAPRELVAMTRSITDGDLTGAREQWQRLYPVLDGLLSEPFIPAVKAGLELRGVPVGVPRAPVAGLPADSLERIRTAIAGLDGQGR